MLCWLLSFVEFDNLREERSVSLVESQVLHVLKILAAHWLTITAFLSQIAESKGVDIFKALHNCIENWSN